MNQPSFNRSLVVLVATAALLSPAIATGGAKDGDMFLGERNQMVGSGGELLVKAERNADSPETVIEVGDVLVGIGVNHLVESLDRPPGLEAFRAARSDEPQPMALRAMRVKTKRWTATGVAFTFEPLAPTEYSELISKLTDGRASIPAESIPKGTFILSFLDERLYTVKRLGDTAAENIARVATAERQWNVGVAQETDFWMAEFPSDEISNLSKLTRDTAVGQIRFGLSLLPGSRTTLRFERKAECIGPMGRATLHDFCLSGSAAGVRGFDTAFPIGLKTQIVTFPVGK